MTTHLQLHDSLDLVRPIFSGSLLLPGDDGYDDARHIHNGAINKKPAVIARCRNSADIAHAVKFAVSEGLEISVRGGGHNVAGRAVTNGGVMIDLSLMNAVSVDPAKRTATAQGGATWATFNSETAKYGLATTGGAISSTGVAGLTLGGGLGWLMAKHGMTVDNLLSAEIVTADGRTLTCNATEHPDLFWGIRGGGGNFGVAASLTFQLHPVAMVIGGLVAHPLDSAPQVLRFFRDVTSNAPDELSVFGGLLHAPDGSGAKLAAMIAMHTDPDAGMAAVQPIKAFAPPIMDVIGPMPYDAVNTMLDGGFPKGALSYWKSSFLTALSDAAIDTLITCFRACPAPMGALLLEHFHGAVTRVPVDATAFPHRAAGYNLLIISQWMDPAQTRICTGWARDTYDEMRPFMSKSRYVNYLGDDESLGSVANAYGPAFERLRKVKAQYDPQNVFKLNQNIKPA